MKKVCPPHQPRYNGAVISYGKEDVYFKCAVCDMEIKPKEWVVIGDERLQRGYNLLRIQVVFNSICVVIMLFFLWMIRK